MIKYQKTGAKLKQTRLNKELKVKDVAEQIYTSPQTVRNWERGHNITLEAVCRLAELYGCYIDVLVVTENE